MTPSPYCRHSRRSSATGTWRARSATWPSRAATATRWRTRSPRTRATSRGGGAAQWIAFGNLGLSGKLCSAFRFAADAHFGVRELAWMAVRDKVAGDVDAAVRLLQPWVTHDDPNIRRFASEATRPRGVWCAQIDLLKRQPWRGLPLLEPLRADRSRYVQNSVANWLNDAARTQPEWVREVCGRWSRGTVAPATQYIVKRAQRSIGE